MKISLLTGIAVVCVMLTTSASATNTNQTLGSKTPEQIKLEKTIKMESSQKEIDAYEAELYLALCKKFPSHKRCEDLPPEKPQKNLPNANNLSP